MVPDKLFFFKLSGSTQAAGSSSEITTLPKSAILTEQSTLRAK
jgi:hypothetical protein